MPLSRIPTLLTLQESVDRLYGLAVKTLAQRSGGTGSTPGRVTPRTLKLVLVADPPGVWHYGFGAKSCRPGVRIMYGSFLCGELPRLGIESIQENLSNQLTEVTDGAGVAKHLSRLKVTLLGECNDNGLGPRLRSFTSVLRLAKDDCKKVFMTFPTAPDGTSFIDISPTPALI
ncbi:hypothetical protein ElyMa_006387600 [Elysia marginata]|uniref:Uncharacterized protein n=1 Tax=Elysia marginata TaxID=1093978 RepID=A0AAV4HR88_9GAST|nr:hypothetical protein ElyMa_006387600 [Elysia marginata]